MITCNYCEKEKGKFFMRELKTIDVDRWVPSEKKGMVRHAGMISPQEAFDSLKVHLESVDLMPDEYFSPNSWDWKDVKELPNYIKAECNVNWGGSEGIYLDISLLYSDENNDLQRFNFATGKTLGESGDDFLKMSRIAAECSMMLNGRGEIVRFYEEEKKVNKDNCLSVEEKAALYDKSCERMNKFAEYMESMHGWIHASVRKEFKNYLEDCGMIEPTKQESLEEKIVTAKGQIDKSAGVHKEASKERG